MLDIHVEKANRNIRGLYVAILKHYLEIADPSYTLFNREDDMGLPSHKAKHDMRPIRIPLKYTARLPKSGKSRTPYRGERPAERLVAQQFRRMNQKNADFYFTASL